MVLFLCLKGILVADVGALIGAFGALHAADAGAL